MRVFYIFVFLLTSLSLSYAQVANSWVEYDKDYLKLGISEDGIYRITGAQISAAGMGTIAGDQVQVWWRGQQVPVFVSTAGTMSPNDYVEFYGERNNGWLDEDLFESANDLLNPYYSMITDTNAYFLTTGDPEESVRLTNTETVVDDGLEPEQYYLHEEILVFSDAHHDPRTSGGVSYSSYQPGEGFGSEYLHNTTFNLPVSGLISSAAQSRVAVNIATTNFSDHRLGVLLNEDTLSIKDLSGIDLWQMNREFASSMLEDGTNTVQVVDLVQGGVATVGYIQLTYPRHFVLDGAGEAHLTLPGSSGDRYVQFEGLQTGSDEPVIYDVTNAHRVTGLQNEGEVQFVLPGETGDRRLYAIGSGNSTRTIASIEKISFQDWESEDPELVIISHSSLITTQALEAYVDYRSSAEGGGLKVGVYDISEIYDQFGYGISRHPQSLRNFTVFISSYWPSARAVFVVGKGIDYTVARECEGLCEEWFKVPTFGKPGADNLLFTLPFEKRPYLPIGRLPVISGDELSVYLNKVIEYESVRDVSNYSFENNFWTKNILHLSGGREEVQQAELKSALGKMGQIISSSLYGGQVTPFFKRSTDGVGNADTKEILAMLETGSALVTFLGHGSASTLDYNINNPEKWNNRGKYPIFTAMGCSAGEVHQTFRSLAEIFVLEPNAGAIAFVAGSGNQYQLPLTRLGERWYETIGNGNTDLRLGSSILSSLDILTSSPSFTYKILLEQNTITGDPMLPFYINEGADYTWDPSSVSTVPSVLSTKLDSFVLEVDLVNLGRRNSESIIVRVEQTLPDQSELFLFDTLVYVDAAVNTLNLKLPVREGMEGANKIYLTVDPDDLIPEAPAPNAEDNNELTSPSGVKGFDIFVTADRLFPKQPSNYAIVTETQPTLIANASNAFTTGFNAFVEVDTIETFDSPFLYQTETALQGGNLQLQPELAWKTGQVYYWRVALDIEGEADTLNWLNSSFIYLPNEAPGWNQSHYQQLDDNDLNGLVVRPTPNQIDFDGYFKNVFVQSAFTEDLNEALQFNIDGTHQSPFRDPWIDVESHLFVVVFDTISTRTVKNPPGGSFGSVNPYGQRPLFPYRTDTPEDRLALMNFLKNEIEYGHYVVIYSFLRPAYPEYFPEQWRADQDEFGESLFDVIESEVPGSGISVLESRGSVPFVIMYRKDIGLIQEDFAENINGTATSEFNFLVRNTSGTMSSGIIGPAQDWDRIEWSYSGLDFPQDSISGIFRAYSADFSEAIDGVISEHTTDLTAIDAAAYPYLQLQLETSDDSLRTSPDIDYWRVRYTGLPDLAFNTTRKFELTADTLHAGETSTLRTTVANISPWSIGSSSLKVTTTDEMNAQSTKFVSIPSLNPGEEFDIEINFEELSAGDNTVLIQINADRTVLESDYNNNTGAIRITVIPDLIPPVLDVLFNGRYLENYDYINRNPEIDISVMDPSFVALDDPNDIQIRIQSPNDLSPVLVDMASDEIKFTPGHGIVEDNTAKVLYTPDLVEEGIYFMDVTASDKSGNASDDLTYQVFFQVAGESSLRQWSVYPNPARDRVHMAFQLAGINEEAILVVDIFDAGGRIVHTMEESVSSGISDITWDCTDVVGGTYSYRAQVRDANGNNLLSNYGRSDAEVKNDYIIGKIVVVR